MKPRKDIKTKFADYRADVDDDAIHRRWEEIKPFVPKKKERRVLWIMPLSAIYIFTGALLLVFGLWAAWYFFEPNDHVTNANIAGTLAVPSTADAVSDKHANGHTKHADLKKSGDLVYPANQVQKRNAAERKNVQVGPERITSQADRMIEDKPKAKPVAKRIAQRFEKTSGIKHLSSAENADTMKHSGLFEKMARWSVKFPLRSYLDTELVGSHANMAYSTPMQTKKSVRMDVFTALHVLNNRIDHIEQTNKEIGYGYSVGVGLKLPIQNKLSVVGQAMLGRSVLVYNREVMGAMEIASHSPVNKDTIRYVNTYSSYEVKSNVVYHVGLGIEYELFSWRRIFISGTALAMFRRTNFTYDITQHVGKDTLIYEVQAQFAGAPSSLPTDFAEGRQRQSFSNVVVGITPGLTITYRLNEKMALFARPCLTYELSKSKLGASTPDVSIEQKDIFIQIGVQFWKFR